MRFAVGHPSSGDLANRLHVSVHVSVSKINFQPLTNGIKFNFDGTRKLSSFILYEKQICSD